MSSPNLCPVCEKNLDSLSETDTSSHVNNCLDQNTNMSGTPTDALPRPHYMEPDIRAQIAQPASDCVPWDSQTDNKHLSTADDSDRNHPELPPRPSVAKTPDLPTYSDDIQDPTNYRRDPHKLIAYLIPFPTPNLAFTSLDGHQLPQRFLIYTPPPPPLQAPVDGKKEPRAHKVQRKWENEVRQAKQSTDKLVSWKGVKSRATKGINWAMGQVKSADLEFLNRVPGLNEKSGDASDHESDDHKTIGLDEMVLVYPSSFQASPEEVRAEFINSMMRTKSKAQRDSIIATGLLPVSLGIDLLATPVWPFGGLLEVDGVWAYASIRGAKTARSITKRLRSTEADDTNKEGTLKLTFVPSPKMEVMKAYLATRCSERDPRRFRLDTTSRVRPTESDVLEAIAWIPSETSGVKNWEDEQWELSEVKDDLRVTLGKAAKGWDSWIKSFEKDPEKALKK